MNSASFNHAETGYRQKKSSASLRSFLFSSLFGDDIHKGEYDCEQCDAREDIEYGVLLDEHGGSVNQDAEYAAGPRSALPHGL